MNPDLLHKLETGYGAQQRGEIAAAERLYREVLAQAPDNEFALNLLGVILVRSDRFEEAVPLLEKAIAAGGSDPDTLNNLGLALRGLNRHADAESAFGAALKADPRRASVHNNIGNVLAAQDKHADAVLSFERALQLQPVYVDCMRNLAGSLLALGRTDEALGAIDRALRHEPKRADLHNARGEILLRNARHEAAKDCFDRALSHAELIPARINLSTALKQLGDIAGAERALRAVLASEPNNAEAWHHLGVLLEQAGDSDAAAAAFREALQRNSRHASSYYQLAKLNKVTLSADDVAAIEKLLADPNLLDVLRAPLFFALGATAEKRRDYVASMNFFVKAQAIKARRNPYDRRPIEAYANECEKSFPVADPPPLNRDSADPVPIFVVGMPRSGTTLVEQILTSHSRISGAGEVGFISDMAKEAAAMVGTPYPACVRQLRDEQVHALRRQYFSSMRARCGESRFIVDKNPLNFNFVGFITTVFPEARVVYCRRNPVDNCVSIFRLPFDDNQGYSHDMRALGHFYRIHDRLMTHWLTAYPQDLCQVDYEHVVDDLETAARRLLDFVGVEFEAGVLRFFENKRAVLTPSTEQVRRRIYNTSVNQGLRYGKAIAPLLEALGDLVPAQYLDRAVIDSA